jgi:hypothetical protein
MGELAFQANELAERVLACVKDARIGQPRREVAGMLEHGPEGIFEFAHYDSPAVEWLWFSL